MALYFTPTHVGHFCVWRRDHMPIPFPATASITAIQTALEEFYLKPIRIDLDALPPAVRTAAVRSLLAMQILADLNMLPTTGKKALEVRIAKDSINSFSKDAGQQYSTMQAVVLRLAVKLNPGWIRVKVAPTTAKSTTSTRRSPVTSTRTTTTSSPTTTTIPTTTVSTSAVTPTEYVLTMADLGLYVTPAWPTTLSMWLAATGSRLPPGIVDAREAVDFLRPLVMGHIPRTAMPTDTRMGFAVSRVLLAMELMHSVGTLGPPLWETRLAIEREQGWALRTRMHRIDAFKVVFPAIPAAKETVEFVATTMGLYALYLFAEVADVVDKIQPDWYSEIFCRPPMPGAETHHVPHLPLPISFAVPSTRYAPLSSSQAHHPVSPPLPPPLPPARGAPTDMALYFTPTDPGLFSTWHRRALDAVRGYPKPGDSIKDILDVVVPMVLDSAVNELANLLHQWREPVLRSMITLHILAAMEVMPRAVDPRITYPGIHMPRTYNELMDERSISLQVVLLRIPVVAASLHSIALDAGLVIGDLVPHICHLAHQTNALWYRRIFPSCDIV